MAGTKKNKADAENGHRPSAVRQVICIRKGLTLAGTAEEEEQIDDQGGIDLDQDGIPGGPIKRLIFEVCLIHWKKVSICQHSRYRSATGRGARS